MSLAQVLLPAPVPTGMEEWAHAHMQHHVAIITAMRQARGFELPLRQIFPVNWDDPVSISIFLREHQQMHNDFGIILGIQGNDLTNVDFQDQDQRESWFFLNLTQHRSAAEALGQGI